MGKSDVPPRDVFFYYRDTQLYAVRKGPFKAHYVTRSAYGQDAAQKHDPPLLYDLAKDPSEQFNVAAKHPEVLEAIAREVERHRKGLVPGKPQLDDAPPEAGPPGAGKN
jgi:arylsulfatase A-like enzyme